MNPLQEYDFKLMSEIYPVPKLMGSYPTDVKLYQEFTNRMIKTYEEYFMSIYTRDWFIPLMLSEIEKGINKLINKIFQENPSLP